MSRLSHVLRFFGFATTVLLSAFLVFQIQPMISKMILPWFGGSPAVWTTCVLFFQLVLFAGYAYAHLLTRCLTPTWQAGVHIGLLGTALWCLPISPNESWKPGDGDAPAFRILLLLAIHVGLPYFMLSATGPLAQAWFGRVFSGKSPYRLYALSNVGSLVALLSYPFVFEPFLATNEQDQLWSYGFGMFALFLTLLALQATRFSESTSAEPPTSAETHPRFAVRAAWVLLPALASTTLLAVTNHVCQDIAVIPFLWVLPLAIYLTSFIVCFDRESWYSRRWCAIGTVLSVGVSCLLLSQESLTEFLSQFGIEFSPSGLSQHWVWQAGTYGAILFFTCMMCHGELVRLKPTQSHLTEFYLLISAGGAVGGLVVGIVCPIVFSTYLEMQLAVILGTAVALLLAWQNASRTYLANRIACQRITRVSALGILVSVGLVQLSTVFYGSLCTVRNFYGVLRVDEYPGAGGSRHARKLVHGSTVHGLQFREVDLKRVPTAYYSRESGIGRAIASCQNRGPVRVGVIGLGCGTLAAYGRDQDVFRFYEINPLVGELATRHFTFLSDSRANCELVLGDARLSLEREPNQQFDLIVLDAFSSDSIPSHLLTREAFAVYLRHLNPNGALTVHTSNRHLNLPPVVARLAQEHRLLVGFIRSKEDSQSASLAAQWMLLTRDLGFFASEPIRNVLKKVNEPVAAAPLWTDQSNNLFQIMRF